eukprot:2537119-Amphidinium_carterae.1
MLADDVTRPASVEFPISEFLAHHMNLEDSTLDLADTDSSKDAGASVRIAATRLLALSTVNETPLSDISSDAAAACHFSGFPLEGPGGINGMLIPWDAWLDPTAALLVQSTSPEWEWRSSAISLLASIMNSPEVSEAPRSAVLQHLLKKSDALEESTKRVPARMDTGAMSSLAIVMYLREYAKVSKAATAVIASDMIAQRAMQGFREASPALRRLHVQMLALLFYIHHQVQDSPLVPQILRFMETVLSQESMQTRSAVALLCGEILSTFAAGAPELVLAEHRPLRPAAPPHLASVVPLLLKLGKDIAQPARLWMLHGLHLAIKASATAFPVDLLKDALRLTTAHLLKDFFESPLMLW